MSENKQANESHETVADIVKELRRQSDSESKLATQLRKTDDAVVFALASCYAEDAKYISKIAARIEAAWKREKAQSWHHREMEELILRHEKEVAEFRRERDAAEDRGCHNALDLIEKIDAQYGIDNKIVGNAAALREALVAIQKLVQANIAADEFDDFEPLKEYVQIRDICNAALSSPARNCDMPYDDQVEMYYAFKDWCKAKGHTMEPMLACDAFDWLLAPAAERKGATA